MTEVRFNLEVEDRPFLDVYAMGYEDLNEKTGFPDIFIHYIEVRYKGRNITRLLKKRPECRFLWELITENTTQKIYEEINNKIYESD